MVSPPPRRSGARGDRGEAAAGQSRRRGVADGGFPVAAELLAEIAQAAGAAGRQPPPPTPELLRPYRPAARRREAAPRETAPREPRKRASRAKPPPQLLHPRQCRHDRKSDDAGQRAGADPQPAAADRSARRRTATSKSRCSACRHITSDLQEGVMKTRMQPIGNAWNKLPRMVRDLARGTRQEDRADHASAPRPSSTARFWS